MTRSLRSSRAPDRALAAALVALFVTSLLPPRMGTWVAWFAEKADLLLVPAAAPFALLAHWLAPARQAPADDALRLLESEARRFETLFAQERAENARLRAIIRDLQQGRELAPDVSVRLVATPIVGTTTDPANPLLRAPVGRADGVAVNAVAVVQGVQILGRVVSAGTRSCLIQPITSRSAGAIEGVILTDLPRAPGAPAPAADSARPALRARLHPMRDGTLQGVVSHERDPATREVLLPSPGDTVRLDDPQWPRNARMLVIGTVERVEPAAEDPQRVQITVRPLITLERAAEAVLRVAAAADDRSAEPPP